MLLRQGLQASQLHYETFKAGDVTRRHQSLSNSIVSLCQPSLPEARFYRL